MQEKHLIFQNYKEQNAQPNCNILEYKLLFKLGLYFKSNDSKLKLNSRSDTIDFPPRKADKPTHSLQTIMEFQS